MRQAETNLTEHHQVFFDNNISATLAIKVMSCSFNFHLNLLHSHQPSLTNCL